MNIHPNLGPAVLALALACGCAPAAAIGVDYSLDALVTDFSSAPVLTQNRDLKVGLLPVGGLGTVSASWLDADGFAVGAVSYDSTVGKLGFFAHTLSGTANKSYALNSLGLYRDSVSVVTAAVQPVATQVVLNMTVEGDFGGSANQSAVTMKFSAAGQSAFLQLSRNPDPLNPGLDFYKTWNDLSMPPVSVLIGTGTTQHFSETLSLTLPITALPASGVVIVPGLPSIGGPPHAGCTQAHPCATMVTQFNLPVPTLDFEFEMSLSSGSGHGAQLGESLLDLTHTATLDVQSPAGTYFLLTSGGLATDPQSAFNVLPVVAVPEPSGALCLAAGIAVLLVGRRSWTAMGGSGLAIYQPVGLRIAADDRDGEEHGFLLTACAFSRREREKGKREGGKGKREGPDTPPMDQASWVSPFPLPLSLFPAKPPASPTT